MASRSFEVSVNPEVLKWAREIGGWSIEEITKKEYEKKEKDILARMEALKKEESKQK